VKICPKQERRTRKGEIQEYFRDENAALGGGKPMGPSAWRIPETLTSKGTRLQEAVQTPNPDEKQGEQRSRPAPAVGLTGWGTPKD